MEERDIQLACCSLGIMDATSHGMNLSGNSLISRIKVEDYADHSFRIGTATVQQLKGPWHARLLLAGGRVLPLPCTDLLIMKYFKDSYIHM